MMPDKERIRLMARLAMMEQKKGKELRRVQESFRSDYIGIPMLKNALRITAVFLTVMSIWAAVYVDFLLSVAVMGQLRLFAVGVLTAYIVTLVVTLIITLLISLFRYRRFRRDAQEYSSLLEQLSRLNDEKEEYLEERRNRTT